MGFKFRKQPSSGRGEYEVSGEQGGVVAADLDGAHFVLSWGGAQKATNLVLTNQGGKRRVRRIGSSGIQVQRQVASVAMLPPSTREEAGVSEGLPVILSKAYILDVEFELLRLENGQALIIPTTLIARSGNEEDRNHRVELEFLPRMELVDEVLKRRGELTPVVRRALDAYEVAVNAATVGQSAERAVGQLMEALTATSEEYLPGADPLPYLLSTLGIGSEPDLPAPPLTPISMPEIRRRVESEYRRRRVRGAGAAQFRREVRRAYRSTCAFCGLRLPPALGVSSGVDAAHILPWGQFDLDVVQNGLALCKHHHWAFDAHVITLRHDTGRYFIDLDAEYADLLKQRHAATHAAFASLVGKLPLERLPTHQDQWPAPEFIELLYAV